MSKECCDHDEEVKEEKTEKAVIAPKERFAFLKNKRVISSLIAWAIIAVAVAFKVSSVEESLLVIGLYAIGIIAGGFFFAREAIEKILRGKVGIEFLMLLGTIAAAVLGQWFEALMLVGLFSIAEALESYTVDKTRNAIRSLMDLVPKNALVRRDGKEVIVPADTLQIGEIFIVKPGESIATDGFIRKGEATINQAAVTGESVPVFKQENDSVFAGTLNTDGALEIEVTKSFKENTISKIIHLVEEAQKEKGKRQVMVQALAAKISPIVLGISVAMPIVLPFFGFTFMEAFLRAATFIVAAAPCALALSVPIAFTAALGTSAKRGILIKGGIYLEELAETKMVAFDKTGTLTSGRPQVTNTVALNGVSHDELLKIAGSLSAYSSHPLSHAISEHVKENGVTPVSSEEYQNITGAGVKAKINGETFYLGSPKLFSQMGQSVESLKEFTQLSSEGKTVTFVGTKEKLYGFMAIEDTIRPEANKVIDELHKLGVHNVMLSGDNTLVANHIGQEIGVDKVFAELKPDDKVKKIEELKKERGGIVMVGDGINDAPALATSSVGVAMGTIGTDAALEAANVAIMGDDLSKVPYMIKFARATKSIVIQNLAFSVLLLVSTVLLSLFMVVSISQIVFIHEFGEVVVVLNGLRLLREKV